MDSIIREAKKSDFEQLRSLFIEENEHHSILVPNNIQKTYDVLSTEEYQSILDSEKHKIYVCDKGHELLGAIIVSLKEQVKDRWIKKRVTGFIEDLVVTKSSRNSKIGKRLMKSAQSWVQSHDVHTVELHVWEENSGAIKFYESIGFNTVRRKMALDSKK